MDISVKTHALNNESGATKALGTVTFDGVFTVKNIAVMSGKNDSLFVAMPSYKTKETDENGKAVYKDICNPITKEFREVLYNAVLESYRSGKEVKLTVTAEEEIPKAIDGPLKLSIDGGFIGVKGDSDYPFANGEELPVPEVAPRESVKDKLAKGKTEPHKGKGKNVIDNVTL